MLDSDDREEVGPSGLQGRPVPHTHQGLPGSLIVIGVLAFIAQQVAPDNPFARWRNPDAVGLTGDQFKGLLMSGLSQGAMYGLIALGYSMVYGVLGFINFAHGEVLHGRCHDRVHSIGQVL